MEKLMTFKYFKIIFLLMCFSHVTLAREVKQLIPGISLAKHFENDVLQKSGDINKRYIKVIAIKDGDDICGLRVAGHAPSEVCSKVSKEFIDLSKSLESNNFTYGNEYYFSYGVFDSKLDRRLSSVYNECFTTLKQLKQDYPDKIDLDEIAVNAYNGYLNKIDECKKLAIENDDIRIVLHEFPENFIYYYPAEKTIPSFQYSLYKRYCNYNILNENRNSLKNFESAVTQVKSIINEIGYYYPKQYSSFVISVNEPSSYHLKISNDKYDDFWKNQYTEEIKMMVKRDLDEIIKKNDEKAETFNELDVVSSALYLKELNLMVSYIIDVNNKKAKEIEKEEYFNSIVNKILKLCKEDIVSTGDYKYLPLVGRIIENQHNYSDVLSYLDVISNNVKQNLELSEGFSNNFVYIQVDAALRGWPALIGGRSDESSILNSKSLILGKYIRGVQGVDNPYSYIRPSENGGQVMQALSGTVVQVSTPYKTSFYDLEEFIIDEFDIPSEMSHIRWSKFINELTDNIDKNVLIGRYSSPEVNIAYESFKAFENKNSIDLRSLSNDFFSYNTSKKTDMLSEIFEGKVERYGDGKSTAETFACGDKFIKIIPKAKAEFNETGTKLVRYTLKKNSKKIEDIIQKRIFIPQAFDVLTTGSQDREFTVCVEELVKDFYPLHHIDKMGTNLEENCRNYVKANLLISKYAGNLLPSKIRENPLSYFNNITKKISERIEERFSPKQVSHYDRIKIHIKNLVEYSRDNSFDKNDVFIHDLNPSNFLFNKKGDIALVDFDGDHRVSKGNMLGQLIVNNFLLESKSNTSNKSINEIYENVIKEAIDLNVIKNSELLDGDITIEMIIGALKGSSSDTQLRNAATEADIDVRMRQKQDAFKFILEKGLDKKYSDPKMSETIKMLLDEVNNWSNELPPYLGMVQEDEDHYA